MKISDIPQQIRQQLFSEHADAVLAKIIRRADIQNPSSVPGVLFRLLIKELPAHDFIETLSREGNLNLGKARSVALLIKEKILETERRSLFRWGIDISDIKVHDASPLEELEPGEIKKEEKNITVEDIGKDKEGVDEEFVAVNPITSSEKPFILHEEKSPAPEENKSSFKGFSMPFGFFKSKNQSAPAGKSTKVEIETSGSSPKNEKRTVNYSELRTTLSPFEVEQNFINPVKNEPVPTPITPAPEIKPVSVVPEIPPLPEEKKNEIFGTIKKPQPKTEGNTIDLR